PNTPKPSLSPPSAAGPSFTPRKLPRPEPKPGAADAPSLPLHQPLRILGQSLQHLRLHRRRIRLVRHLPIHPPALRILPSQNPPAARLHAGLLLDRPRLKFPPVP